MMRKYTDLNSGTEKFIDRPEGNKLMLEIENGIISELYVYSIDRFGKNASDILSTINLYFKRVQRYCRERRITNDD
jgi:DNA invertase Pin-like site-specific DNA recombinase